VVHATYDGSLGGRPSGTARIWRVLGPATAGWAPGSAATQVIPELLAPGDLVLPRHHGPPGEGNVTARHDPGSE
jgi:hypothetical protein